MRSRKMLKSLNFCAERSTHDGSEPARLCGLEPAPKVTSGSGMLPAWLSCGPARRISGRGRDIGGLTAAQVHQGNRAVSSWFRAFHQPLAGQVDRLLSGSGPPGVPPSHRGRPGQVESCPHTHLTVRKIGAVSWGTLYPPLPGSLCGVVCRCPGEGRPWPGRRAAAGTRGLLQVFCCSPDRGVRIVVWVRAGRAGPPTRARLVPSRSSCRRPPGKPADAPALIRPPTRATPFPWNHRRDRLR
jgi:hypothetical protein